MTHVLITARRRAEDVVPAAQALHHAGMRVLAWTPELGAADGWLPSGCRDPGDDELVRSALRYVAQSDPGSELILLPLDRGWEPTDALRVAEALAAHPGAVALAVRTTPGPAGERFNAKIYSLAQGRPVSDLYAGLAGWPPELVRELNKPSRLSIETRALTCVRPLDLPVVQVPLTPGNPQAVRSRGLLTRDLAWFLMLFLRFAGSSIISAGLDYAAFAAMLPIIGNVVLTNIAARVISSAFNFAVNRTLVFQSGQSRMPLLRALLRYYTLAAVIASASTGLLYLLNTVGLPALAVKLPIDVALYVVNFLIQREYVFYHRRRAAKIAKT